MLDAGRLVAEIARAPRPAGGEAEAAARQLCERVLREAGFTVTEERFEFSAFPGTYGPVVFGVVALATAVAIESAASREAAAAARNGIISMGLVYAFLELMVPISGIMRRRSTNLVAVRDEPRIWLNAHLDSKSQGITMRLRLLAGALLVAAALGGSVLILADAFGLETPAGVWTVAAVLLAISGLTLVFARAGNTSPGALDDASGVAAVLLAASAARRDVAVVLTSGEEMSLAGSRAFAGKRKPASVVTVEALDDEGPWTLFRHGARSDSLAASLEAAARRSGVTLRRRPLVPGLLMDSVAFARRKWPAVAITRVSRRSLSRIHTPRDSADRIAGNGVELAAVMLGDFLREQS